MTGATLITDVRKELMETSASFWSDAELLVHINNGEADYFNRIRGQESDATVQTVAGDAEYPLPANWLSAQAIFYNDVQEDGSDNWIRLRPTNLEKMAQEHPGFMNTQVEARGAPQEYFIRNKRVNVFPIPDTTGRTIKMFFKCKAIPLTSGTDSLNVDDTLSQAIRAYVLWKAWSKEKELELAAEQRELYFNYVGEGRRWVKRRSGDQRNRIDVESNRPYSTGNQDPFAR